MKGFYDLNPIVQFCYFILSSAVCMFSSSLVIALIALVGAVVNFLFLSRRLRIRSELGFFVFFVLMAFVNPFFVRNGTTVILVVNDRPITLEALVYGIFSACVIVAVIYMFRLFSSVMTSDKLLYVFGTAFPKLSLVLSGAIRYVSLLSERKKRVEDAHRAFGSYGGYGNMGFFARIKGSLRVFSALVSWSLENSIITADSMSARGYGVGKRRQFSLFRFGAFDLAFSVVVAALGALAFTGEFLGIADIVYYPTLKMPTCDAISVIWYVSYALLVLMPTVCKISEEIRWKYLRSAI